MQVKYLAAEVIYIAALQSLKLKNLGIFPTSLGLLMYPSNHSTEPSTSCLNNHYVVPLPYNPTSGPKSGDQSLLPGIIMAAS